LPQNKGEQTVRGSVLLPHGTGKKVRVVGQCNRQMGATQMFARVELELELRRIARFDPRQESVKLNLLFASWLKTFSAEIG